MTDVPRSRSPRLTRRVGDYLGDVLKWTAQMTISAGVLSPLLVEGDATFTLLGALFAALTIAGLGALVIFLSEERNEHA
jgi:hypothetical protein